MIYIQYQELILDNKTTLINVFDEFIDENNEAKTKYYQDGLHLNERGYQKLTNLIEKKIQDYL